MFPPANDDFTRGKSPLVGAVNGLSDPKPNAIKGLSIPSRPLAGLRSDRDDNNKISIFGIFMI